MNATHPPAAPCGNVLFLGFWGVHDPLTTATILPGIRVLHDRLHVPRVVLGTVERGHFAPWAMEGVEHLPWRASDRRPRVLARSIDHLGHVRQLVRAVRRENVRLIIARASTAGSFGYSVSRITGVPLVVESFEPHADYMADCGEWDRGSIIYRLSRRMEQRQIQRALALITVSRSYHDHLLEEGADPHRVMVAPCPVDLERFRFSAADRARLRASIGAGDGHVVGVYAGKFGGMYHDRTAFEVFTRTALHLHDRFKLAVLTPEPKDRVEEGLRTAGFPMGDAVVQRVPHDEVPAWLSAADLAFALYKRTITSRYLSPVKVGEYWACGLPVLLTEGVADDGGIITGEGIGGAVFDPMSGDVGAAIDRALAGRTDPGRRERVRALAQRHRSIEATAEAYRGAFELLARRNA